MAGIAYKVLLTASGIVAGKAAKKATTATWKTATGGTPPVDKHDPEYSALEVAIFAIVSSAIAGGLRAYAQRKASDFYTRSAGELPPPVRKAKQKSQARKKAEARANRA